MKRAGQNIEDTIALASEMQKGILSAPRCAVLRCRDCRVFLLPRKRHLLALLEFLSVFVSHLRRGGAYKSLSSFLPKVLQLLSAVSSIASDMQQPGATPPAVSGDWSLTYKTLLVVEQIMGASGGLAIMEGSFSKAAEALKATGVEDLRNLLMAAEDPAEKQSLQQKGLVALLDSLEIWEPPLEKQKKVTKAGRGPLQHLTQQQQQQVWVGLHAARLWKDVAGSGLSHMNAWTRCAALRCVTNYLQQKPLASWRHADTAALACIRCRLRQKERKHEVVSQPLSPLTDLGLSIGQHLGSDTMLERHPYAAPNAIAALMGWTHLACALPHLVPVFRKPRTSSSKKGKRFKYPETEALRRHCEDAAEGSNSCAEFEKAGKHAASAEVPRDTDGAESAPATTAHEGMDAAAEEETVKGEAASQEAERGEGDAREGKTDEEAAAGDSEGEEAAGEDDATVDEQDESQDEADGGEAAELVMQEMHEEASKDARETQTRTTETTTPDPWAPFLSSSWTVSSADSCSSGTAAEFSAAEKLHPLAFLVAGLGRWLRVHLGRLGYTAAAQRDAEAPPGTIVRVAGILAFFGALLKLLPFKDLRNAANQPPAAAAAATPAESVLLDVLRHIADGAYRCSTLQTELQGESLLYQLIDEKSSQKAEASMQPAAAAAAQGGDSQMAIWGQLGGLSPVRQLKEVATGGAAVLRRMEQLLRNAGLEETYRVLLSETRQNVSAKRVMRKLHLQKVFLENPQVHAQRKRRRNQVKGLQRKAKLRQTIFRHKGFVKRKPAADTRRT